MIDKPVDTRPGQPAEPSKLSLAHASLSE
jgi:hypothetical protein